MRPFPTARHPILSLLQSAAAELERRTGAPGTALREQADALTSARRPTSAYGGMSLDAMTSPTCAGLGLALLQASLDGDTAQRTALEDRLRFSDCDPGWAEVIADYARRFLPDGQARPIPYRPWRQLGDFVVTAPQASLRVGLLSDWGTGTDEARHVAALLAAQRPDMVIHLGDIYYAGTPEECDAHFLTPLRTAMPHARLFTLCGNHDVYAGGDGYYGLLDRIGQPASYFCLRAPDRSWQILAADTGRNDRDPFDVDTALTHVDPREEQWHLDKVRGFPGRTILLTHHQPFSAFAEIGPLAGRDPVNPNLMATHGRLASAGRIDAWFWGHEHSLRLYAPYRGVACGRNVGYGAIPVDAAAMADAAPLPGLLDPPQLTADIRLDVVEGALTHGFALLDFEAGGVDASYWAITQPAGPIHRETIARGAAEA